MFTKRLQTIIWIVCLQLIGMALGLLTQANIAPWYDSLHKSQLTPPPVVFAIVWPILYMILAFIAQTLWQRRYQKELCLAQFCFWLQLIMNWAWSIVFFQLHWIGIGFIWIVLMCILTAVTLVLLKDQIRWASLLLVPYLVWLLFASYLNGVIWFTH